MYKVRVLPILANGTPDTGTLLFDSGPITDTSFNLFCVNQLQPGSYGLDVEAIELSDGDQPLNRSRYIMKIYVVPCWGDINGDCRIGLEEAIHALQVVSGIKAQ
jgi:hypothetical protein